MGMSKADFQEIADAVVDAKRHVEYGMAYTNQTDALRALEQVTKELATACAQRYTGGYGFNRQRFVKACGFPEA